MTKELGIHSDDQEARYLPACSGMPFNLLELLWCRVSCRYYRCGRGGVFRDIFRFVSADSAIPCPVIDVLDFSLPLSGNIFCKLP